MAYNILEPGLNFPARHGSGLHFIGEANAAVLTLCLETLVAVTEHLLLRLDQHARKHRLILTLLPES
jgi:hypothetical protein